MSRGDSSGAPGYTQIANVAHLRLNGSSSSSVYAILPPGLPGPSL